MPHRNCILMNRIDLEKAGLKEHQRVTVKGNAGKLEKVEIIRGALRLGAALMFYPEVNVIFNARVEKEQELQHIKEFPYLYTYRSTIINFKIRRSTARKACTNVFFYHRDTLVTAKRVITTTYLKP